ncbi:glycosyl hydrolase family 28-related protein [Tichowtungia aerotolerans]|uniref:Rhamnogalacturonase A/B/Epimerase-like pectate lyase domain-containing protein n=1 Tax=Tichowtungia aerotolerans TaxID=2697043 RepID=A0A6P1MFD5_9BACT|nr:glycosyl hydrolase family 28-related protein [Tichowtungia aerotolerans]QHI70718.1 hypothetical protein GT409_15145 [Tichowtungia aerotolerans]
MMVVFCLAVPVLYAQVDSAPFLENSRVYNPLDYGADPTGTTDSSPAFNAMIADIGADPQVEVFIPPGRFLLNSRVTFPVSDNSFQHGVSIRGGGQDATELWVNNAVGGLFVDASGMTRLCVQLSDLSFVAMQTNITTAFEFEAADAGDPLCRQLIVENVYITSPIHTSPNFFATGIKATSAWGARFVNVTIRKQGEYVDPVRHPEYGIFLQDCRAPVIRDCHINKVQTAIYHGKVNSTAREATIVNTYLVGVDVALDLQFRQKGEGWPLPNVHIDNCHFNYYDVGVNVVGARQVNISHVLFYCSERDGSQWYNNGSTTADYDPVDVDLVYASNVTIDHCLFVEPASPRRRAVQISSDSSYVLLSGNQFNMEGTAVYNQSSNSISCINSVFGGMVGDFSGGGAWLTRYVDTAGTMITDDLN